jgi:Ca2+/Na+ antiporter
MSFTDRLLLWLHIGFAIFSLGPVTAAMMATPRYIRKRDLAVLRYLYRTTRVFGMLTVGVFLFGLLLGRHDFNEAWFSAAMTLFIVAAVLLVLVVFDQRKAITAIDKALAVDEATAKTPLPANTGPANTGPANTAPANTAPANAVAAVDQRGSEQASPGPTAGTGGTTTAAATAGPQSVTARADERAAAETGAAGQNADEGGRAAAPAADAPPKPVAARTEASAAAGHLASVERGRIVTMGGVITAIWLVILVLMVWHG